MNKHRIQILAAFCILLLAALACNFSASTANISEAFMARDQEGADPTTVFAQDDIFYCIVQLANAPDDTVVKAVWTAVNVEGEQPDLLIDEVETTSGDGQLWFELSNSSSLWPLGTYKVDLYLNDKLDRTLDFSVQ
jgi:hypothetical protein